LNESINELDKQKRPKINSNQSFIEKWNSYVGDWNSLSVVEEPSCYEGKCSGTPELLYLKQVTENDVIFNLLLNNGRKLFDEDIKGAIQNDGHVEFNYTDLLSMTGKGNIYYKDDTLIFTTTADELDGDGPNWTAKEGTRNFYKSNSQLGLQALEKQKEIIAEKEAEAKKKEEDEEKKKLARITQRSGTLTVNITDIQYSASLKISQLNYNVINDANADGMAFAVWNFEFYNVNNKLISTSGGGTNALMPGEGIKSMMFVDGDIRKYAYFKLSPVTEGVYPINDPYKFSR
jgi:hypothetical protein